MEPPERILVPASNVNALGVIQKSHGSHVLGGCPARRTVNVFCVLGKSTRPTDVERVNKSQRDTGANNHEERTEEHRLAYLRVRRAPVFPDPPCPLERLVQGMSPKLCDGRTECWLIAESVRNELCRRHVGC